MMRSTQNRFSRPARPRITSVTCGAGAAILLALLAACQSPAPVSSAEITPPPPATSLPAPAAAAPASAARPTLVDEQRRLAALFRGTPVVFAMQSDGRLQVDVPLRHSFDAGQSVVKPPLAAVLDRIALSQAGGSSRVSVSATGDRVGGAPGRPPRPTNAASGAGAAAGSVSGAAAGTGAGRGAGAGDSVGASGQNGKATATGKASPAQLRQERVASERRRSLTDYLIGKGLNAGRLLSAPAMPAGTSVRLLIDDRPAL